MHRRPIELEGFIDLCDRKGVDVRTVKSGDLDLSTASGKMVARMLGAAARHEVEHSIERQRAAKRQAGIDGKFRGARRPFGYERNGVTAHHEEAAAIREGAKAVLSGVSLRQISRDWNAQGLRTRQRGHRIARYIPSTSGAAGGSKLGTDGGGGRARRCHSCSMTP